MARRVSIIMDDDLYKKLQIIQAKQISKTNKSISFSRVLNNALRKQLK